MSLKRKRVESGPPGIRKRIPPGIKKAAITARKRRQNKLRGLLAKPQLKYHDSTLAATEASYDVEASLLLNGVSTGDSDITRDGQTIVMNSVHVKGVIKSPDSTSTVEGPIVRYLIVLDKMPNEQAWASSDVILRQGASGSDVYVHRNRTGSNQDRYRVLVDRVVQLGSLWSGSTQPSKHYFEHFIKLSELCVFNDDGTGNDTDFQKGKLQFFAISDKASAATGPTIELKSRVTFFDK